MRIRWVKRSSTPPLLPLLVSGGSFLLALGAALVAFAAYGLNPLEAGAIVIERTLIGTRNLGEVVRRTIPLLLAGAGLVLALRARFWNIGAEGQILAGAVAASGVALFVPNLGAFTIPAIYLAGFVGAALYGLIPAFLKARLGVNEIITTLMFNYVALYVVRWLINGPWRGKSVTGFSYSDRFARETYLPMVDGTRVHIPTLVIGIVLAVGVSLLLRYTRLGFSIRLMGEAPAAARYAGVRLLPTTLALAALAAGAAGLAGAGEVAGIHHRLIEPSSISMGYGYTAILVALLARGRAWATLITAPLLGWVLAAGDVMKVSLQLPFQLTDVFTGFTLLLLVAAEPLLTHRPVLVRPQPRPAAAHSAVAPSAEERREGA
ncbi:MAG TPA: ABC transporter permease [Trueperaceae bacterium]|nr:ABC transporter permease [Trueperaceae bacterium]